MDLPLFPGPIAIKYDERGWMVKSTVKSRRLPGHLFSDTILPKLRMLVQHWLEWLSFQTTS
jgi:hypothetical protein